MTFEEFMNMDYVLRVEPYEDYYKATIVELDLSAEGDTDLEAIKKLKKLKIEYYNSIIDKDSIPTSYEKEHSGVFRMRVPKILHQTLTENAKKKKMSLNQYCIELLKQG